MKKKEYMSVSDLLNASQYCSWLMCLPIIVQIENQHNISKALCHHNL